MPETGNAITGSDFIASFTAEIDRVNRSEEVKAIVITGAGEIFSSGGNVHDMAEKSGLFGLSPIEQRRGYRDSIQSLPRLMTQCEVATIAAVNGPAVGAGCDLALMCDLRVVADSAFFAESFVQLGLVPGDGGTWFLDRLVGPGRAAEMTLTGDRIDAATALDWGIANRVVARDELLPTAHQLAGRIAKNPGAALRMAKRMLLEVRAGSSLDSVLNMAAAMQPLAHLDPEHLRRVTALTEGKR